MLYSYTLRVDVQTCTDIMLNHVYAPVHVCTMLEYA